MKSTAITAALAATTLFAMAARSPAADDPATADAVTPGSPVTVFEHPHENYRVDLTGAGYRHIDGSMLFPDASFTALRLRPHAVSLIIAEELALSMRSEQYAEAVQWAMQARLADDGSASSHDFRDLGTRETGGVRATQKFLDTGPGADGATYVISAIVDGNRAYQLLTFSTTAGDDALIAEADRLLAGFSIPDPAPVASIAPAAPRSIDDYRSTTFGYRIRAEGRDWMDWPDVTDDVEGADFGALSLDGYGLVVMPACWQGAAPAATTLYRVALKQFGEDYPSDFVTLEREVAKGAAAGRLFVGTDTIDGEEYLYHIAMLTDEHCAWLFAAWGPTAESRVEKRLASLWDTFAIGDEATAPLGRYGTPGEQARNAAVLNTIGLQAYAARSHRDAFRYFDQANMLAPADPAYAVNAVQALAELSAYQEAADWLSSRLAPVEGDPVARSWDAWLAYQLGESDKAIRIYRDLFAAGYREDNDFSAFATLLADAAHWDELDRAFERYAAGGKSPALRLLEVELLGRRGDYDDALALLDGIDKGRAFNPDTAYARIDIYEQMENPAGVLRVADELIANNYRSLQSYFYKGSAQFELQSYRDARATFEQALTFAPGNKRVREYLDAIDSMLGEGDVMLISRAIDPVPLPQSLAKDFADGKPARDHAGYGAEYLSRMKGLTVRDGDAVITTFYQKMHIFDDSGVEYFSTLQFDFDASSESLFVNALRVLDPDGELVAEGSLQSYFITSDEDGYEASTDRTAHLPVPKLKPGMTIEAVISKRTNVEPGTVPLETHFLASDRPIRHSAVFVAGEAGTLGYLSNTVTAPERHDGALIWRLDDPVAFRWEPLQPDHDQILPWVMLGSVGDSWEAVGADYLDEIADKLEATGVSERAADLLEGVDDGTRRIEILSAYVQDEITYKAIEFGRRAYIPKPARETLRDRYGDCKDHAVLLTTMLKAVGIEASLALVNLGQAVNPALPNTDQFNHMIVAVPIDGGHMFIDATDKDLKLGALVPRSLQGNHALILDESPSLVEIPAYAGVANNGLDVERIVEFAGESGLAVRETARLSGYQAANLREQLRTIEAPDMQAAIQRWVAGRYADAEVTDFFVENVFDANFDLLVEIQYSMPIQEDGKFDLPGFLESYYLEYERMSDRRFPFEFYYPLRVSARTSVRIPPGRELAAGFKRPETGESRFGHWQRAVAVDGNDWEVRFDYEAVTRRFPAEEYREFADFQRDAIRGIELPVVLR